jgi:hypothetical protein
VGEDIGARGVGVTLWGEGGGWRGEEETRIYEDEREYVSVFWIDLAVYVSLYVLVVPRY